METLQPQDIRYDLILRITQYQPCNVCPSLFAEFDAAAPLSASELTATRWDGAIPRSRGKIPYEWKRLERTDPHAHRGRCVCGCTLFPTGPDAGDLRQLIGNFLAKVRGNQPADVAIIAVAAATAPPALFLPLSSLLPT